MTICNTKWPVNEIGSTPYLPGKFLLRDTCRLWFADAKTFKLTADLAMVADPAYKKWADKCNSAPSLLSKSSLHSLSNS